MADFYKIYFNPETQKYQNVHMLPKLSLTFARPGAACLRRATIFSLYIFLYIYRCLGAEDPVIFPSELKLFNVL